MISRFEAVKYDDEAADAGTTFLIYFKMIEEYSKVLCEGRSKSVFFTKLEEAFMWAGKAIRDDQLERNRHADVKADDEENSDE